MRRMAVSAAAVLAALVVWSGFRPIPALGYFPPDQFEQTFKSGVSVQLGIKNIVFFFDTPYANALLAVASIGALDTMGASGGVALDERLRNNGRAALASGSR